MIVPKPIQNPQQVQISSAIFETTKAVFRLVLHHTNPIPIGKIPFEISRILFKSFQTHYPIPINKILFGITRIRSKLTTSTNKTCPNQQNPIQHQPNLIGTDPTSHKSHPNPQNRIRYHQNPIRTYPQSQHPHPNHNNPIRDYKIPTQTYPKSFKQMHPDQQYLTRNRQILSAPTHNRKHPIPARESDSKSSESDQTHKHPTPISNILFESIRILSKPTTKSQTVLSRSA